MTQPGSPPNDSSSRDDRDRTSPSPESPSSDSTSDDARDDSYRRVRDDFDGLDLEHQATFLVDATVSLLAKGIETAGRALADEVDGFVERQRKKAAEREAARKHADETSDTASRPSTRTTPTDAGDAPHADVTDEDAQSDDPERDDSAGRTSSTDDDNGEPEDLPPRGPLG